MTTVVHETLAHKALHPANLAILRGKKAWLLHPFVTRYFQVNVLNGGGHVKANSGCEHTFFGEENTHKDMNRIFDKRQ